MRRLRQAWLWGALILLVAIAPACAQGVQWQIHAGFDGVWTYGSPLPALIEITNNGPARKGQLTVGNIRGRQSNDSVRYTVPLDLPENSHKIYSLEIRNPSRRQITLALNGVRETREIKDLQEVMPEDVLVVVISENPALLQFLNGSGVTPPHATYGYGTPMGGARLSNGTLAIAHTSPGDMPRSWAGWQGVDIAVVAAERLSEASPEAIDALRQWVQLGGQLVINGGMFAPSMGSGPLGEMLPLQVTGTRTVSDLRALGTWVSQHIEQHEALIAAGQPVPDARVLCGSAAMPLITMRNVGVGTVAMTAFDLTGRPVKYWDGQEMMWARLVAELDVSRGRWDEYAPLGLGSGMSDNCLDRLVPTARAHAEPGLPSHALVLGFLLTYIIVLVPVSYVLLARRDRREWAWVTTPVVVLIFTFGAYGIGFMSRGGKTIVNRLALVVARSGSSAALGSGTVAIFSPVSRNYSFDLNGSVASLYWGDNTGSADPANVVCGPQRKITGFRINKWSCRALTADFVADLGEGIEAHGVLDGQRLTATVTNNTGLPLRGCRILYDSQEGPRRDLSSGASTELTFDDHKQAGGMGLMDQNLYFTHMRASSLRRREYRSAFLADLAVAELAQTYPRQLYGRGSAAGVNARPYLLAICDQPMLTVEPVQTRASLTDCTIIIIPLKMTISSGKRIAIADWMVTQTVAATEGTVATVPRYDRQMTITDGAIELDLQVETGGKRCRAQSLEIGLSGLSPGNSSVVPTLRAWSLSRGEWVKLTSGGGSSVPNNGSSYGMDVRSNDYVLQPPGDFMTEDGVVRVRLSAHSEVNIADVKLTGEIETY